MAIISFSAKPEETWCVAGWAFRQVLADVLSQNRNDEEMASEFKHATAISGLSVHLLEKNFADRVTNEIRNVAQAILAGDVKSGILEQPYGDTATIHKYLESLKALLRTVPAR